MAPRLRALFKSPRLPPASGTNGDPARSSMLSCARRMSTAVEISARAGSLLLARSSSWGACLCSSSNGFSHGAHGVPLATPMWSRNALNPSAFSGRTIIARLPHDHA